MNVKHLMDDVFFTQDFSILFCLGNWRNFKIDTPIHKGNTLARLSLYTAVVASLYFSDPRYLLLALLGLVLAAFWFGKAAEDEEARRLPFARNQNIGTYHEARAGAIANVHDASLAPSDSSQREVLASQVLANVREQNHYLGENLGVPSLTGADELMFGGTRFLAPDRTEAIRSNPFFVGSANAAMNGVTYTPVIPINEI